MVKKSSETDKFDKVIAEARRRSDERALAYREKALKLYPWVCGRCGREFNHQNLQELTVHHRDHNHDNNPEDGSNWELLCLYCHDNEHARYVNGQGSIGTIPEDKRTPTASYKPFAGLQDLLKNKKT